MLVIKNTKYKNRPRKRTYIYKVQHQNRNNNNNMNQIWSKKIIHINIKIKINIKMESKLIYKNHHNKKLINIIRIMLLILRSFNQEQISTIIITIKIIITKIIVTVIIKIDKFLLIPHVKIITIQSAHIPNAY